MTQWLNGSMVCLALLAAAAAVAAGEAAPEALEPTPEETLLLEYVNRMRAAPAREGELIAPPDGLPPSGLPKTDWRKFREEMRKSKPVPPLVFNYQLITAARGHSLYCIVNDQSHEQKRGKPGYTGRTFMERVTRAGYDWAASGENIFRDADSPWDAHLAFVVDYKTEGGVQSGRPHRRNMLDKRFREIGIGVLPHGRRLAVVMEFGRRNDARLAGGVVFADWNGNGFYDLGEGVGAVHVEGALAPAKARAPSSGGGLTPIAAVGNRLSVPAAAFKTRTWKSGGYVLELKKKDAGTLVAEFGGQRLEKPFPAGEGNVKCDWALSPAQVMAYVEQLIRAVGPGDGDGKDHAARVALYWHTRYLPVSAPTRARIEALSGAVGARLLAAQREVRQALRASDPSQLTKAMAHEHEFAGTAADEWFEEAVAVAGVKKMVNEWMGLVALDRLTPDELWNLIQKSVDIQSLITDGGLRQEVQYYITAILGAENR